MVPAIIAVIAIAFVTGSNVQQKHNIFSEKEKIQKVETISNINQK